jgi:hypothetical protein
MIDSAFPAETQLDRLLFVMPRIAEAVNGFASPENQRIAGSVLMKLAMNAFGLQDDPPLHEEVGEPNLSVVPPLPDDRPEDRSDATAGRPADQPMAARRRTRKPAAKKSWRARDINFRPEGKPSLREFEAEKKPKSFPERNAVAVYYLAETLGVTAIDAGHVLAAYTECEWRVPADIENCLMVTSSRKDWLNTSDMKAISLTNKGRNLVLFDLPSSSKKPA